ncbi:MAG: hypothetical protein JW881_09820 [Spirochaetales bacterium]|nr:hypothetical protein [Spirochaetales bacterium]
MYSEIKPVTLNITLRQGLSIKSGEIVTVNIIKQLSGNKWAVGIRGKVFPAFSEFSLTPGKTIKAEVIATGRSIKLKIITEEASRIMELIKGQGLPDDSLSRVIITSLLKSGLMLDSTIIAKMRHYLQRKKDSSARLARILASLIDKNIDISGEGVEALVDIMRFGEDGGRKHDSKKENFHKNAEKLKEELEKQLEGGGDQENCLKLYNHMKGSSQTWFVIPYAVRTGNEQLTGTIRIQYNQYHKKVERCVCIVNDSSSVRWSFYIRPKKGKKQINIFCNNDGKRILCEKKIDELRVKVRNAGVEIDDIIHKEDEFDGFSPDWEISHYKKINTMT